MEKNSFSIIIPVHEQRDDWIAVSSILRQKYPEDLVEIVVIEDANAISSVRKYNNLPHVTIKHHDQRLERAISRNEGMELSTKDWILWLDSDDELISTTLYDLDYWIRKEPDYKIFHWGGIVYWEPKTWDEEGYEPRTSIRPTAELEEYKVGMKPFKTGKAA